MTSPNGLLFALAAFLCRRASFLNKRVPLWSEACLHGSQIHHDAVMLLGLAGRSVADRQRAGLAVRHVHGNREIAEINYWGYNQRIFAIGRSRRRRAGLGWSGRKPSAAGDNVRDRTA